MKSARPSKIHCMASAAAGLNAAALTSSGIEQGFSTTMTGLGTFGTEDLST